MKNNTILVDRICKLEDFDNEMKYIFKKLNLKSEIKYEIKKSSKKHKLDSIKELSPKQKEKIQKICYKDFKILGYKP